MSNNCYLGELRCSICQKSFSPFQAQTYCHECQAPLLASYNLETAKQHLDRDEIARRPRGMWRWRELLPVYQPEKVITLGEGDTPLLPLSKSGAELGLPWLYIKDESLNPTGTFKARGMSAAISKANELGIQKFVLPTAGNAGGAMAAFAAAAGLEACVIMPEDAPLANVRECQIAGAEVIFVKGLIDAAARLASEKSEAEGWFDLSTFKEPYRVEGKKVMGYELAQAFNWELPDVIVYPTGGGTGLVGMWKAFDELETLGWLESRRRPRLVAVQSSGCAPVVKAWEAHAEVCEVWENAKTIASGLRVPRSFADRIILRDLRQSHGQAIAVDDSEILAAQARLGRQEGIFAAPEGAATFSALLVLLKQGWIEREERVVLFNTGSGLKYL